MMVSSVRRLMAVAALSVSIFVSQAQPAGNQSLKKETQPYKVISSGKEITIKQKARRRLGLVREPGQGRG